MHRGYIKLWRKIEEWTWFHDVRMVGFFIHLLIRANHKDTTYQGFSVPRGSLVCGRNSLSKATKLSAQSIRSCIKRLKSTNEITIQSTNKFSIICIVNYEEYQEKSTIKSTSKVTNNQPATNQQLTTSKECKNEKNEKKVVAALPNVDFLTSLKSNPAYKELDLDKELGKCQAWCIANKKICSQRRFVNWINRAEKPIQNAFIPREKKPSSTCSACNSTGKLPDGKKCWCY